MRFITGNFVVYRMKNELGLIKSVKDNGCFVYYHMGGTLAFTSFDLISPISTYSVLKTKFTNEYAKASLFERQACMQDDRNDVDDLIDERHIRISVKRLIDKNKFEKI